MPRMPPAKDIAIQRRETRPTAAQTSDSNIDAASPASVPGRLMPPSVPAGTTSQVVIMYAVPPLACPYSLETVSAAASARAVDNASSQSSGRLATMDSTPHAAAAPRLASTCEAVRPPRRSAVPRNSFWRYPSRVVRKASTNTAATAAKAPGPAVTNKTQVRITPATAPRMSTACNNLASTPKPSVTASAGQKRCSRAAATPGWNQDINKCSAINYIPQALNARLAAGHIPRGAAHPSRCAPGGDTGTSERTYERVFASPMGQCKLLSPAIRRHSGARHGGFGVVGLFDVWSHLHAGTAVFGCAQQRYLVQHAAPGRQRPRQAAAYLFVRRQSARAQ